MRNRPFQFTAIAACLALSASAVASPTSNQLHVPNVADVGGSLAAHGDGNVHNVMWMDTPKDPRDYISKKMRTDEAVKAFAITEDELALIKKTFGHLFCRFKGMKAYGSSSADLGVELDEIVVPMHSFDKRDISSCYFQNYDRTKIKIIADDDYAKKYAAWDKGGRDIAEDRIVLKLVKPVSGIRREELFPFADAGFRLLEGTTGIFVSGYQTDWGTMRGVAANKMPEPLAYACEIKLAIKRGTIAATNCAIDRGGSGGKMLVRDENGRLTKIAMQTNFKNFVEEEGVTLPNGTPFDNKSMYSVFRLVDSEFVGAEPEPKQAPPIANNSTKATKPNVKSNVSTTPAQPSSQLSQRSNFAICSRALNNDQTAFDDRGFYTEEIEEAQRRGFDVEKCKAEIARGPSNTPSKAADNVVVAAVKSDNSTTLSKKTNSAVCSRALNSDQTGFDDRGFYNDEIAEAKRRGFDVEKCKAVVNLMKTLQPGAQSE